MQPAMRTWHRRLIARACTRLSLACAWPVVAFSTCTAVKVLYSTVATAQLALHTKTESNGFVGNLIRQRHSRCRILSHNVQLSTKRSSLREESVKHYVHDLSEEFAHPKLNVLHLPQHFSQLEARNTDDDNAKQQKRKIEYSSNCSQPLACAPVSHPVFKQAEERPVLHSAQRNHRCPRSNKRHFFIAQSRGWPGPIHFLWQKSLDMP